MEVHTWQYLESKSLVSNLINAGFDGESIFSAPAFIGRLIPVHKLDADFLYKQIVQLRHCIHNNGGLVYAMMSDNLRVNQKVFKLFHQHFKSLNILYIFHCTSTSEPEISSIVHSL